MQYNWVKFEYEDYVGFNVKPSKFNEIVISNLNHDVISEFYYKKNYYFNENEIERGVIVNGYIPRDWIEELFGEYNEHTGYYTENRIYFLNNDMTDDMLAYHSNCDFDKFYSYGINIKNS